VRSPARGVPHTKGPQAAGIHPLTERHAGLTGHAATQIVQLMMCPEHPQHAWAAQHAVSSYHARVVQYAVPLRPAITDQIAITVILTAAALFAITHLMKIVRIVMAQVRRLAPFAWAPVFKQYVNLAAPNAMSLINLKLFERFIGDNRSYHNPATDGNPSPFSIRDWGCFLERAGIGVGFALITS